MRLLLLALLGCLGLILAVSGPSRAGAEAACTSRTATKTTVAEIARDSQAWSGRCVTVKGLLNGAWLYDGVDGFYRLPQDSLDPSSNGLAIGLQGDRLPSGALREAAITGVVGRCQDLRAALDAARKPGEISWLSGFCHYYDSPFIAIVRAETGPFRAPERQRVRKGDDYGDLAAAPSDWVHLAFVQQEADRFLTALRAGDRPALAGLLTPEADNPSDDLDDELDLLLKDPNSVFAELRRGAPSQTQYLLDRFVDDGKVVVGDDGPGGYDSTVCFCRTANCEGRWPIARMDADNLPTRPYACIVIGPYQIFRKGLVPQHSVPIGDYGLAEPGA